MKAVVHSKFGNPSEVVSCEQRPEPEPQSGQIRVRMKLSPVHNHDFLTVKGLYGNKPQLPAIGGTEAMGIVDRVGPDVTHVQVGDRVTIARAAGAWAEYFVAPANAALPIAASVPDELAAQLSSMPFSAALALNQLGAQPGEWVVINAANGAVGKTLAQVAANRGVQVAGIVRSKSSQTHLKELGFKHVFASSDADWQEQVRGVIGEVRVAGGVDMVGGAAAGDLMSFISQHGVLLSFGAMSDPIMQISTSDLIYKEATVIGFWASRLVERVAPEQMAAIGKELVTLAAAGKLTLPIEAIFSLDEATQAMKAYTGPRKGKIVFRS